MKKSRQPLISRGPALSSSLRPSGVPDIELPYGVPPSALSTAATGERISRDLRRRIRALANNANKVRRSAPLTAALCWHESGRLLHLHAGRLAEAWICYSRAIAIYPDFKPSLSQLRRLARQAQKRDLMEQLVMAELERTSDALEKSALLSELAAVLIRDEQLEAARGHLKEAIRLAPKALIPRVLLACIASGLGEDGDDMAALSELAPKWEDPAIGSNFRLLLARMEEKRGHLETALARLDTIETDRTSRIQVAWARLRICLKLERYGETLIIIDWLERWLPDPSLVSALSRLKAAIQFLCLREPPADGSAAAGALEADRFTRLMIALRAGDRRRAAETAGELYRAAHTAALREALAISKMVDEWRPGEQSALSFGDIDTSTAACRATVAFLKMGTKKEERVPEIPAAALARAVETGNWERAAQVLGTLRAQTPDEDARWPLAVVESAIRLEHIGPSTKVLDELVKVSGPLCRRPLPTILRAFEKRHSRLADIAMSETGGSEDRQFVALRLGWAAYHMESADPFEAARLYTQSLDFDPSLLFSISGLERTSGTRGGDLAKLYLLAHEATDDRRVRARALLRAGVLCLEAGMREEATPLFGEASELLPKDEMLGRLAYQLSVTYPRHAHGRYIKGVLRGGLPNFVGPMYLGTLGLRVAPAIAAEWFDRALKVSPQDTIARRGNTEALIRAGRVSILSERLLAELRTADSDKKKAAIYQRIAHIDRFHRNDDASAALSLLALDELVPGHCPTLVRLAVYLLTKRRIGEISRVLVSLSHAVTDEADGVALARVSAHADLSPAGRSLLTRIAKQDRATILELTSLEGECGSAEERRWLLERIAERLPGTHVFTSRLADAHGALADYERAVAFYKRSLEGKICVVYNLFAMADHLRKWDNPPLLLDTLVIAADYWHTPRYKINALLEAAALAQETIGDDRRAAELALHALSVDPRCDEAFLMGQNLLTARVDDRGMLLRLVELRLAVAKPPFEAVELHLKAWDTLGGYGDDVSSAQAEAHLDRAMEIVREGVGKKPEGELDGMDFDAEISAIVNHRRYPHAPTADAALFTALGVIYRGRKDTAEIARQYLDRALALDEKNVEALSHLAEVYLEGGDEVEAAGLLGDLIPLMTSPESKLEKMLLLARIQQEALGDDGAAEGTLQAACRLAPLSLEPLERLADLYERQGDQVALGVCLTSALASHGEALKSDPDDPEVLRRMAVIAERKGEPFLRDIAADLIALARGNAVEGRARWRNGPKAGALREEEYIFSSGVTIGLRNALRVIDLPLSKQYGYAAETLQAGEVHRTKRRDPMHQVTVKLARSFGVKDIDVFIGERSALRVSPGEPPGIVFPEILRAAGHEARRFAAASALQTLVSGFSLATWMPIERLRRLLHGVVRLLDEEFTVEGVADQKIAAAAAAVGAVVPASTLKALKPSLETLKAALSRKDLGEQLAHVGHRAGLLASGSIVGAVAGLRALANAPEGPLSTVPGADLLLSFAFSRDHLELSALLGAR